MIEHEVKVGAFILFSLALLIFIIMWLHKFDMASYLHITAKFEDVGTLTQGASVLYRGVKAGTIYDIEVSPDEEYVLVKMNITNKKVHLYEGSTACVIDKGFTGTKVLTISPPESLKDKKLLKEGDYILGTTSFTFEDLQRVMAKLSEDGTLEDFIRDSHKLIKNSRELTDKLEDLASDTSSLLNKENSGKLAQLIDRLLVLSANLNTTSTGMNRILRDNNLGKSIKSTVATTQNAVNSLNKVIDKTDTTIANVNNTVTNINDTTTNVNNTLNNPDLHGSLRDSMTKMSDILTDVKSITGDKEMQTNLKGAIKESKDSINSINCFGQELSNTLSKRFLLPRLMFGKPAKNLNKCFQNKEKNSVTIIEPEKND